MAPAPRKPPIKPNLPYCCSVNLLLLKVLEMGCTLASLILAVRFEGAIPIIIIEIIAALSFVTALSWTILYCLNLNARFPDFFPKLMLGYHSLMGLLNVASTVCAAFLWPNFKVPIYLACTFTSLGSTLAFFADALLNLLAMRGATDELVLCPCSPCEPELTI